MMTMGYELDELDAQILSVLQEDGRKSFRKIAESVGSTPVTVINRVEKMQDAGVITGFTASIDYRELDYTVVAIIEIMAKGSELSALKQRIEEKEPHVTAMYEITGDTDLVLVAKFRDRDQLSSFVMQELSKSDMVEKTVTHLATDSYWERNNLPVKDDL